MHTRTHMFSFYSGVRRSGVLTDGRVDVDKRAEGSADGLGCSSKTEERGG